MTLRELKQIIAELPEKDWYQNYELNLDYTHVNFKITLVGIAPIYEFVLKQIEGFEKHTNLPTELNQIRDKFISAKENIIHLIKINDPHPGTWSNNLRMIVNNSPLIFLSDWSETEFLIKIFQEKNESYRGAYEYFTTQLQHTTNKNYFDGYILAHEFLSKDFSSIAERKESERRSIMNIRSDFQKKLGEAEKEVVEYIFKSNEKFTEYATQIDSLKSEKDKVFKDWFIKTTGEFSEFNTVSIKIIKDLEELYQAKLKLEAPARYWNARAKKLRIEGYWWLIGLVICLIFGCGILIWVLNKTADGTLQKIFSETATAVKWSVTLITLISFLAYGIRIFSKLTFSSFHLVRDAEEREQLTYVYLALQKEKGIDQTERHLIMQSLFSRADSGLLKDDAGPTMPGNIIDQVAKK
jgi:hypothetical protein